jgi:hypothetical protein
MVYICEEGVFRKVTLNVMESSPSCHLTKMRFKYEQVYADSFL